MSQRRSALGRGLGALISNPSEDQRTRSTPKSVDTKSSHPAEPSEVASGSTELDIASIDPNPEQPRREFDDEALEQLSRSIERHGVLQPVVVRRAGSRYELIMGERRFRASQLAGRKTIPAIVADVAPADRLELAIVENVQREDLNPIELAHAYRALADAGHTQEEIGRMVAMDRSSIANHLRLLDLSRDIQQDVESGLISMGHAKALLQVTTPEQRERLRVRITREGLSVRASEQAARELNGQPAPAARKPRTGPGEIALDADTRAFLERIERRLQTKVSLHPSPGGGGRIEIRYFGLEDLERLGDMLLGEAR